LCWLIASAVAGGAVIEGLLSEMDSSAPSAPFPEPWTTASNHLNQQTEQEHSPPSFPAPYPSASASLAAPKV
jgi:hypothetical protein